jgi:hypothetical protein
MYSSFTPICPLFLFFLFFFGETALAYPQYGSLRCRITNDSASDAIGNASAGLHSTLPRTRQPRRRMHHTPHPPSPRCNRLHAIKWLPRCPPLPVHTRLRDIGSECFVVVTVAVTRPQHDDFEIQKVESQWWPLSEKTEDGEPRCVSLISRSWRELEPQSELLNRQVVAVRAEAL